MSPIPIIAIGKSSKVASKAREDLLPQYDVIHIILSVEQGVKDLPLLLSNPIQIPADTEGNHGSRDYSARPLAVTVGGGYDDAMFQEMRDACKDVEQGIFWLRVDVANIAGMPNLGDADAYGAEVANRIKKKLNELCVGQEGAKEPGLYFFL
ncbi:hypothetical protein GQ44DRAFT_708286 [Phaeosphaeriaceae sp. PMI808]|nr:hypothetical protein GQ44DRAFT_708286 [Phaeosphaeriaceae sp. PMI808]